MEKRVSFSVPDIVNVEVKSFTNPVTGEEQDIKNTDTKGLYLETCRGSKIKDNEYYISRSEI
jgi:hypothetical protein